MQSDSLDAEAVEHPAPPERQQVGVIRLAHFVAGDLVV
jgi:hypothetical protein